VTPAIRDKTRGRSTTWYLSVNSPAPELTASVKPNGRVKVRDRVRVEVMIRVRVRVRVRVRIKFSVSVSLNKNNSGAGELTDKYLRLRRFSL